MNSILKHGNSDKPPSTTASHQEISSLRQPKESYPAITIAQFRDIYLEDIIYNKEMKIYVKKNSLVSRSSSWFRNLFIREGWKSPAQRKLRRGGRSQHTLRDPAPSRDMLIQIDLLSHIVKMVGKNSILTNIFKVPQFHLTKLYLIKYTLR